MCGIVGIVGARGPVDPAVLSAMRDRLAHRGPDDAGIAFSRDGLTGFGHRRLAILDPSPAGHQPMWNRSGTLVTTYNGEIYNFRELAAELAKHGYTFQTRSDTEVLLAAFEHWGLDAVEHFQGMFAFALWSEEMHECVLVRDRLGVKPLYYAIDGETLYFASEATALHEVRPKELDSAALGDYLAYGYVPGERTIWRGIQKLRPGHLLVFGAQGPIIRRYWSPPTSPDPNTPRAPGVLRQELSSAVEQAMISDVPVGAFLSGGLDSATLVALAAQLGPELHSYTIDFDHGRTAGAALARQVAERYRTDHHERLLSLDTSLELMRKVVSAYDEPLADESIVPTYVIAGEVARDLKVVLSGDGGDEIFAGYRWYAKLDRLETLRSRLGPLSSPIARLGSQIPESRPPLRRLRRGLQYLGGPTIENYFRLVGYFDRQELRQLIDPAVAGHFADDPLWAYRTHWRPELPLVRRLQTLDLQTYLPDDILTKVDRASMRHSLEARVPYLDHRVVEHALRLPTAAVYASGAGKLILKSVAEELLPEALLAAPKQGFGLQRPVNGDAFLSREAARLEAGTLVRMGLVRPQSLADLLDRRIEGRNPNRIWLLYALDLWLEAHLG